MIHAGNFALLVLKLLNGMIALDSECLDGRRVSNVTTEVPGDERCTEINNYTAQYCQCCSDTINKTHLIIKAAQNRSIMFANTEELSDIVEAVKLVGSVLNTSAKIRDDIRNCTSVPHSCLLQYEDKKNRTKNYTDAYNELQDLLGMASTTQNIVYYYMPPLITIVFIFGMIGNGTLLYIFYKHPETRSGPKILLVNLAISDILLLLFNFFAKYYFRLFPFTLGQTICYIYTFLAITPARASILSIMVLSITRYIAVSALPGDRSHKLLDYMPIVVTLVWAAASLEALEPTLDSIITKYTFSKKTHCDIFASQTTGIVMAVVTCFLPFAVIGYITFATYRRLRGSLRRASAKTELDMAKERNVKILPALALFFAITYPPLYIFWLIASIYKFAMTSTRVWFYYLTQFLLNINSALNPVVLYLSSGMFREYFDRYLRCRKRQQQQQQNKPENSSDHTAPTPCE